ncbi:hypothetical protein R3P38DRAFT_2776286 [Favolaschia claudopus]|uniref:Uncharacterized protein n=1 Tax=Favolaschia claudopus TaxID=2862362 RepID=A0AAW0BPF5_9AGAR
MSAAHTADGVVNYPNASGATGSSHFQGMFDSTVPMDTDNPYAETNHSVLLEQLGQNDAPEAVSTPAETRSFLQQEFQRMLEEAQREDLFGEEEEEPFIGDDLPKAFDEEEEDDPECWDPSLLEPSEYHPYPNKTAMLLDVMDNLPRCRFSSAQMSLVIHFAKQLGAPNVPSLKSFRKLQKNLGSLCGGAPTKVVSDLENIFYVNDIRGSIARDFENPLVAPHMRFYPEETTGPISETYQAERWMEYSPAQLTPMFSKGHKCFWIEEVAQLRDGTFVIPHTWITRHDRLTSDVHIVAPRPDGLWHVMGCRTINADDLELDYNDVIAHFGDLNWVDGSEVAPMPNDMRKLVNDDEDLFVVMVSPWADDVSGNKSKQYNKHMNIRNREFAREPLEPFDGFSDVKATERNPVRCYNAATNRISRFIIRAPGLPADNPQQSEEACHMGSNANFPCRKCNWGGTKLEKESDETYHECHFAGVARDAEEIRQSLKQQLRFSMLGNAKAITEHQRSTGTKDKTTQHWIDILLEKAKTMKLADSARSDEDIADELEEWLKSQPGDKMNPLLEILGLDPSQDTPVELLHTILLGVIKYIWHLLNTNQWSDEDRLLLAARLQSTDLSGLTVPALRAWYMMQYRNNLIGKHFKTLMQILPFHVHAISTPEQFTLIKAAGELGARLWVPEIHNMDEYLAELKIAIANLLDAFDKVDPLRILLKIKLHLLAHIPDDIRHFGPLIRWATEIYEAYNGVFRLNSIFSNRIAPSRDIAAKFASMDRVKHILSGGYWLDSRSKRWIQAGKGVRKVLLADPIFQRHLGWVRPAKIEPGVVKPMPSRVLPVEWHTTKAATFYTGNNRPSDGSRWRYGQVLTAESGDKATVGCWVFATGADGKTVIGRVSELLVGERPLVTLEQFICSDRLHPQFDWPVLRRPNGAEIIAGRGQSHVVLEAKSIRFICSVQHDCRMGNCKPNAVRPVVQEREETNRTMTLIQHSDDDHFVINMAGLHNFVHVCRSLPRALVRLKPLHADRKEFHRKMAALARSTHTTKRAKTAQRRRETAAAKRKGAEEAAAAAAEAEEAARRAEEGEEDDSEQDQNEEETGCRRSSRDVDTQEQEDGVGGEFEEEDAAEQTQERPRKRRRVANRG